MGRSAFTLIELLVVVGLIAILSVTVIIVIAPAELLRQGRDSTRLSDMETLNKAVLLYATDRGGSMGTASTTYLSIPDPSATSTAGDQCQGITGVPALPAGWTYHCPASSTYKNVDGTGWIPLNLKTISSGAPVGALPVDPTNQIGTGFYYTYTTDGSKYELTAIPESQRQKTALLSASMITSYPDVIAQGTNLALSALWIPSGIVRYWTFNDASGTAVRDSSGSGDTGTIGGSGATWTDGKLGKALFMPDTATISYSTGANLPTTRITVTAWVNVAVAGDWHNYLQNNWYANDGSWALYSDATKNATFALEYGGSQHGWAGCTSQMGSPGWHLVAGTFDGSNVSVYVDGTTCGSSSATIGLYTGGAVNTNVGSGGSYTLDEMRVYNRALSPAELQAIYNSEK